LLKRRHQKKLTRKPEQAPELAQEPEPEREPKPEQEQTMELAEIITRAKAQLTALNPLLVSGVIGAAKKEDGWHVAVELVERKGIPDAQDLLGVYEAVLDDGGNMVSYQRKKVRRRSDTLEEAES